MIVGKYLNYVILGSALAVYAEGGGLRKSEDRKLGYVPGKNDPTISVSSLCVWFEV